MASHHSIDDGILQQFGQETFDAAQYLNSILSSLEVTSKTPRSNGNLAEVSTTTQDVVLQLNAKLSRSTNLLNALTDDIIRTGGKLEYEVELLRGEAAGIWESMNDTLRQPIQVFIQDGLNGPETESMSKAKDTLSEKPSSTSVQELECIKQLRTLALVRQRLDHVVEVFGEAMEWVMPPSELSLRSSFISVSSPEAGMEEQALEKQGREFIKTKQTEILQLAKACIDGESLMVVRERVNTYRSLVAVWKGTQEEKYRLKFVDSLQNIIEERVESLSRVADHQTKKSMDGMMAIDTGTGSRSSVEPRYGFLEQLQKVRDGLYLE